MRNFKRIIPPLRTEFYKIRIYPDARVFRKQLRIDLSDRFQPRELVNVYDSTLSVRYESERHPCTRLLLLLQNIYRYQTKIEQN